MLGVCGSGSGASAHLAPMWSAGWMPSFNPVFPATPQFVGTGCHDTLCKAIYGLSDALGPIPSGCMCTEMHGWEDGWFGANFGRA